MGWKTVQLKWIMNQTNLTKVLQKLSGLVKARLDLTQTPSNLSTVWKVYLGAREKHFYGQRSHITHGLDYL